MLLLASLASLCEACGEQIFCMALSQTIVLHALVTFLEPCSCPQHMAPEAPPWAAPGCPGTAQAPADWLQGGAMVLKTVTCRFSGLRIYPGRGIQFIRTDGAVSGSGTAAWCTGPEQLWQPWPAT